MDSKRLNLTGGGKKKPYVHFTLIVNKKTREILTYGFNNTQCQIGVHGRHDLHSEESAWWFFTRMKHRKQIQAKCIEMINFRLNKNGVIRMAKPCVNCEKFIWHRKQVIRRVWWSDDGAKFLFDSYHVE